MHWMVHLEGGPRRVNHAAVAIGDHIYSFGGYCSGEVQCRNEPIDIHLLNTATYRWQRVPSNSDREAIARRRLNSLKPSTSSQLQEEDDDDYFSTHHNPAPTRRRARSVAELHPLGQLRYIRPAIDNTTNNNNPEETASNSSSSGRFSGLGDETDAIDSDELASMEVDDDESSSLSDIDEEAGQDSDYEDFPQARFVNPVAQPDAYAWPAFQQQQPVGGANMQGLETQVPYQRYGHTVVAYDGKAYLWGGRNDEFGSSQLLHQYDPATNEWSVVKVEGMHPPSRDGHTAVMHHHTMIIFGGFEESNHRFSQETYAFDFKTNTWHQVITQGDPPQHRDFHTACVLDSKMYIFGGRSDEMGQHHSSNDKYCDQLMCLDLKTNSWMVVKTQGDAPNGRRSHSVWTHNGKMYMFGGYQSNKDEHYNDLYEFNPTTSQWRLVKPNGQLIPSARRRQCTIAVGNRMFLFGGTMPRVKNDGKSLMDLADLFVLDFQPSLEILCSEAVVRYGFHQRYDHLLPNTLRNQLYFMSASNTISKPNCSRLDCNNG